MNIKHALALTLSASALTLLVACGAKDANEASVDTPQSATQSASAVTPTGRVIEVTMESNEKGNYFEPAQIDANPGDVVRFKLESGVHNVHFLADSNPGISGLPAASDMLQLPGQTYDVPVNLGAGTYYFQCDPHAALGMKGHIVVAAKP